MASQPKHHIYEFGPFCLIPHERQLWRGEQIVALPPKVFDTLLALVENSGHLVGKEELMSRLWPDSFVEEATLARNISDLRKALGETSGEQRYIETIPRHGYRFVTAVRHSLEDASTLTVEKRTRSRIIIEQEDETEVLVARESDAETHPAEQRNAVATAMHTGSTARFLTDAISRHRRSLILGLGALLVGVTIAFVVPRFWQNSQTNPPPSQRKLSRLTFDPGLQSEPAWSPDGRMIAYSSNRSGNFDLWVQMVEEGNAVQVTTNPAHDWQPDWSPDGKRLVFRSERDEGGLFVVPVLGGSERKVSGFGCRPRWSPDGSQILFYSAILQNVVGVPKVCLVGLDGKPPREFEPEFLAEFDYLRVAWHPDGERVSLWGRHLEEGWGFWTIPLTGGARVKSEIAQVVEEQLKASVRFNNYSNFLWAPSGRALYFEGSFEGIRNLWRVEVEPQTLRWVAGPERLTTDPGPDTEISISPDGKKLAYTLRAERTRIWSLPFNPKTGRITGGEPITPADRDAWKLDLSADGRKLVFEASQGKREELWEKSLDDGRERLLVADDAYSRYSPRWSRDGSRLAYRRDHSANPERTRFKSSIVEVLAGGDEQAITSQGIVNEFAYDWSSDGEWILGNSERHTPGRYLICLFPVQAASVAESQMRVVTSHPEYSLWQPRFSPDEHWICFNALKPAEAGVSILYVVPARGGEWTPITAGKHWEGKGRWSPDGRTIYFVSNRTGFFNVWGIRFDPHTGKPVGEAFQVTDFESPAQMVLPLLGRLEMALAADRLVLPITEVSGSLWILENVDR